MKKYIVQNLLGVLGVVFLSLTVHGQNLESTSVRIAPIGIIVEKGDTFVLFTKTDEIQLRYVLERYNNTYLDYLNLLEVHNGAKSYIKTLRGDVLYRDKLISNLEKKDSLQSDLIFDLKETLNRIKKKERIKGKLLKVFIYATAIEGIIIFLLVK